MSTKDPDQDKYRFRLAFLHPRYWLTWLGLSLFFLVTLLPMSLVDRLGQRLGSFAANKNKKRFNIAKKNLSLCFPEKNNNEVEAMVFSHFKVQFRSLLHYYIIWWRSEKFVRSKIQTIGFEKINNHKQQGKNVIILLMHNVGLDFAVAAITLDYNANGPYKAMRNKVIDWLMACGRSRFGRKHGGKLFTRDDGLRPLIRETRKGKVLIYLADEDLGPEHSIFAPFYGVQKATIPVLGRLAKSCNAVVLPCVSCYEAKDQRYTITLLPEIEEFPSDDDEVDTLKMNQAIERSVEHCPVQYLWTLRYFQTRPPGEESVYD